MNFLLRLNLARYALKQFCRDINLFFYFRLFSSHFVASWSVAQNLFPQDGLKQKFPGCWMLMVQERGNPLFGF